MIPFYIFYSMFGFQRTGDEFWAFADARGRGFLLGARPAAPPSTGRACSTRTATACCSPRCIPSVRIYDPAFAYETAVAHPRRHPPDVRRRAGGRPLLPGSVQRELRSCRRGRTASATRTSCAACTASVRRPKLPAGAPRATILGSGSIMQQALRAQTILAERFGVAADVWSAPSYQLLRNEALEVDRWNLLHPAEPRRACRWSPAAGRARLARSHRGRQRLDPGLAGPDLALGARRLVAQPGHRRLRAQRLPREPAPLLRGRCGARRGGRDVRAWRAAARSRWSVRVPRSRSWAWTLRRPSPSRASVGMAVRSRPC